MKSGYGRDKVGMRSGYGMYEVGMRSGYGRDVVGNWLLSSWLLGLGICQEMPGNVGKCRDTLCQGTYNDDDGICPIR